MKNVLHVKSIKTRLIMSTFLVVMLVTIINAFYEEAHYRKMTINDLETKMRDITRIIAFNRSGCKRPYRP
jgi:hypothetical protein